jgi:hypothetical protein
MGCNSGGGGEENREGLVEDRFKRGRENREGYSD